MTYAHNIHIEKCYYTLFSCEKWEMYIFVDGSGGRLRFMREQNTKNSGRNEISMPITIRNVVLHIFVW